MNYIENIDCLRARKPLFPGESVFLTSHSSELPGLGGGIFQNVPSETRVDDNGCVVRHSNGDAWVRVLNGNTAHISHYGIQPSFAANADKYRPSFNGDVQDATTAFQSALVNNMKLSFESDGGTYYISDAIITRNRNHLVGTGSTLVQGDKFKEGFQLVGDYLRFTGGTFTHNTDPSDYDGANNGKFFKSSVKLIQPVFEDMIFRDTAQQAMALNGGSVRPRAINCSLYRTLRDGLFWVDCEGGIMWGCYAEDTGDDSFVFAEHSIGCQFIACEAIRPGMYVQWVENNTKLIGGAGFRTNGNGTRISNCRVQGAANFGVVAAVNDTFSDAQPRHVIIDGLEIDGIGFENQVTAGIAFKNIKSAEVYNTDINIQLVDTDADGVGDTPIGHAFRIYDDKTDYIKIQGGTITGAKSVMYMRNEGPAHLKIRDVRSEGCHDFILAEQSGHIDLIELENNHSIDTKNSGYIRCLGSGSIGKIDSRNNKRSGNIDANARSFEFGGMSVGEFKSFNDQYQTISGDENVTSIDIS